MKKVKCLLIMPLLITMFSCNKNSIDQKGYFINKLIESVNVKVSGSETTTYEDEYSYLNTTTPFSLNRDYKIITEEDGSKTPAVRDNSTFTTYFRGENGQAITEVLTPDNKVTTKNYQYMGLNVLYNDFFSNPFEFIDSADIGENYSLNATKASLIIKNYTGLNYAVKNANFIVENNIAKSLNITAYDRLDALISDTEEVGINYSLDINIDFDYTIGNIEHLTTRGEADDTLKSAFANQMNYTMTFSSDSTANNYITYVTEEAILIHKGIQDVGLNDGDEYYIKSAEDSYIKYSYVASTNKFSLKSLDVKKSSFLPNISSLSPNILTKDSDNVYLFDKQAATYGLEKMILPMFSVNNGTGVKGTLVVENNHFSTLVAQFGEVLPVIVTQNYSNFGNTSMPEWLDVSMI